MLVKKVEIAQVMPCIADPAKIRVIAKADCRLEVVLPYLDKAIPTALYSEKGGFLTYKRNDSYITFITPDQAYHQFSCSRDNGLLAVIFHFAAWENVSRPLLHRKRK